MGGGGEMTEDAQPLAILVQPASQTRPLSDQRLVSHLHGACGDGHQPRVGEGPNDLGRVGRAREHLIEPDLASGVCGALAQLGEA